MKGDVFNIIFISLDVDYNDFELWSKFIIQNYEAALYYIIIYNNYHTLPCILFRASKI